MTILYGFLILNVLSFSITAYDKQLAIKNKRRISEKTLLTWVALGGTIGSSLAMSLFRHKTAKKSYLWKFFLIVLVQIIISYFLISNDIIKL